MQLPFELPHATLSMALSVLTAMITPALLISACGTFILSTSNRLGRVVDRARSVLFRIEDLYQNGLDLLLLDERRAILLQQLDMLSNRAVLLQRSLTTFYVAAGIFVSASVAIGIGSVVSSQFNWVPVVLGILGACFLLVGCAALIVEARLAVRSLQQEMTFMKRLVETHRAGIIGSAEPRA